MVTIMQAIALCFIVAPVAYVIAHHFAGKKIDAAVEAAKAAIRRDVKAVEEYTDEEVVKLSAAFAARLARTEDQNQIKADADAVLARRAALLAKVQAAVAAAKPGA